MSDCREFSQSKNTTGKVELPLRCKETQPVGRQRVLLFNRFSYYRKKLINCRNSKLNLVIGFLGIPSKKSHYSEPPGSEDG